MKTARRGGRTHAALDRDRIARAALARIEAGGAAALSMRSLARDLGCEAMSLYHHVEGIEGVLDAVVDALFDAIIRGAVPSSDPRRALEGLAEAYLEAAETRPNAFPLLAARLLHTPRALAAASLMVGLLREIGLAPRAALRQARVLAAYLNGAGLAIAAWRSAPGGGHRSARAAQGDAGLGGLAAHVNAAAVRADLKVGLRRLLDSL